MQDRTDERATDDPSSVDADQDPEAVLEAERRRERMARGLPHPPPDADAKGLPHDERLDTETAHARTPMDDDPDS